MSSPLILPRIFGTATSPEPMSYLDDNFNYLANFLYVPPTATTMTGDVAYTYPGGMKKVLFLDPNGADRNVNFTQTPTAYPVGFEIVCFNYGPYVIVLDSSGAAIAVPPGPGKSIYFDGTNWLEHS